MKLEYQEGQYGLYITLTPETPEEAAQLLRYANNAKAAKPQVYFSFGNKQPYLSVILDKKRPVNQTNSINPFRKK